MSVSSDMSLPDPSSPLLGSTAVATWLGMSREQVWRLWKSGQLAGYRLDRNVRFSVDDVRAFLEQRRTGNGSIETASAGLKAVRARTRRQYEQSEYRPI